MKRTVFSIVCAVAIAAASGWVGWFVASQLAGRGAADVGIVVYENAGLAIAGGVLACLACAAGLGVATARAPIASAYHAAIVTAFAGLVAVALAVLLVWTYG